jgi:hypothetical protein
VCTFKTLELTKYFSVGDGLNIFGYFQSTE